MPDLHLARDGRDVASFRLTDRPTNDTPLIEINGTWHPLVVDEDDEDLFSVHIHGPQCTEPAPGSVQVLTSGGLLRVGVDDVIRTTGRVYLK